MSNFNMTVALCSDKNRKFVAIINLKDKFVRMKNFICLCSLLAAMGLNNASAQTPSYPDTDNGGNAVYYKIANAYPEYSKFCIEDNTRKAGTAGYKFIVEEMAEGKYAQEWQIVAAANDQSGTYYLRNRSTRRYISPAGVWKDNYYAQEATGSKVNLKPFTFQDLKDSQIAIKYADGSDERYLFAADSAGVVPSFNSYGIENSVWAWKVCTANGVPVSVGKILKESNVKIKVEDRVIKVEGTGVYTVVNDEGAVMPKESRLMPGVYFVNAEGVAYKVLVK